MRLESELPLNLTLVTYTLDDDGARAIRLTGDLLPARSDVYLRSMATAKKLHVHTVSAGWEGGFPAWERHVNTTLRPKTTEQAAMVFLLRSAFAGGMRGVEFRHCLDSLFDDHVSAQAKNGGGDEEVYQGVQGTRLHYPTEVRAGADVLATGVSGACQVVVRRDVADASPSHGIRFVTEHDAARLRSHVKVPVYGLHWLRPSSPDGMGRIEPVRVSALPPSSLEVPRSCLRGVRFMETSAFYGNIVTFWVAQPPSGGVFHSYSLEHFTSECASARCGNEWRGLLDALHQHPVIHQYSLRSFGQHVSVASTGRWKIAQIRLGTVPRFPEVAGVVTMKVRRHKGGGGEHTWLHGKTMSVAGLHHLCFHAQLENGQVETRCMVSPRTLVGLASTHPEKSELVEDFEGILQVRRGLDGDVLWHVRVFAPEAAGAVTFARSNWASGMGTGSRAADQGNARDTMGTN